MSDPQDPISVGELTRRIKGTLNDSFSGVYVSGEISGYRGPHSSGHIYTTLKDSQSQVPMVIWRSTAQRMRFRLEEGMEVIVRGDIDVYAPRGSYQLIVKSVEPKGMGDLQLAFRQLCEQLQKEGLFDAVRKRPLPAFPKRIGIVSAPTGAAIRDMLRILHRRDPRMGAVIYPARVQGEGAKEQIANGIRYLNQHAEQLGLDLLIVGRGGGSLEDLWAFNEEIVARAIAASELPIVSAVGHEIDTTVADLVADLRAATPSEAAELVAPELSELQAAADDARMRLNRNLRQILDRRRSQLDLLRSGIAGHTPKRRLQEAAQTVDYLGERLARHMKFKLDGVREQLAHYAQQLEGLSPLKVLARGYAVARQEDGQVIHSIKEVKKDARFTVVLGDGEVSARAESTTPRDWLAGTQKE